jgi:type I restriction enzyme S subunit
LVTTRATLGEAAIAVVPVATNQGFKSIIPNTDSHSLFTYYLIRGLKSEMERLASGTTFREISKADFSRIKVCRPKHDEQARIAAVLDTVDEAIAKTEAVIAKLKQVRAGLLHDLLTRGLDEDGQLRDPIVHPEQFQDSPLGRIPREWRISRLRDILQIPPRNGYSPREAPTFQGSYLLGLGCITTDGFAPIQLKNAPLGDPGLAAFRLNHGELLISRSNTRDLVGLPGVYRDVGYPCYYPDLIMRLVPKRELSPEFLELILGHSTSRAQLVASASGTSGSMIKITGAGVMEVPVAYPLGNGRDEQRDILAVKGAIEREIGTTWREHAKLSSLKSGLMTDLLTGRVRVPEEIAVAP